MPPDELLRVISYDSFCPTRNSSEIQCPLVFKAGQTLSQTWQSMHSVGSRCGIMKPQSSTDCVRQPLGHADIHAEQPVQFDGIWIILFAKFT